MTVTLALDPLLPIGLIVVLALVATAAGIFALRTRSVLRTVAIGFLALGLLNPTLVREEREPLPDIVALVTDSSQSLDTPARRQAADAAAQRVRDIVEADPELELVEANAARGEDGTFLFDAMFRALAEAPRRRLAAVVAITDGRVHDAPRSAEAFDVEAPIHAVIVGDPRASDRRLEVRRAPPFGIVGERVQFELEVFDSSAREGEAIPLRLALNGGEHRDAFARIGETVEVGVEISRRGPNVVEIIAEEGENELTLANNRAAISVSGVRDRLRVLLVTGEPHAGARSWRDLLKSDPSVDLIHFTILRPPDKSTPGDVNELSLIGFPTRELFEETIDEFDLIIFDVYKHRRDVINSIYLTNIAEYVEAGGALLIAAGPPFVTDLSLFNTSLSAILPARPAAAVFEGGYRPALTDRGRRHPVTSTFAGAGDDSWGRWFRIIETNQISGDALMRGPDDRPLLILDRVEDGRVAMVLSDQTWLWARGADGGGPHSELFRRLAHWLMGEPDLEEERLSAETGTGVLSVQRRTMGDRLDPVIATSPSGEQFEIQMTEATEGLWLGEADIDEVGLFRISSGDLTAVAAAGPLNPRELNDLTPTDEVLLPFTDATGGGVFFIGEGGGASLPDVRRTRPDVDQTGRGWMGWRRNEAYASISEDRRPLAPALLGVAILLMALTGAWAREGR